LLAHKQPTPKFLSTPDNSMKLQNLKKRVQRKGFKEKGVQTYLDRPMRERERERERERVFWKRMFFEFTKNPRKFVWMQRADL
jgi:hypothetical protein